MDFSEITSQDIYEKTNQFNKVKKQIEDIMEKIHKEKYYLEILEKFDQNELLFQLHISAAICIITYNLSIKHYNELKELLCKDIRYELVDYNANTNKYFFSDNVSSERIFITIYSFLSHLDFQKYL